MKFQTKPLVIEATQWFKNGDHPKDYEKPLSGIENKQEVTYTPEQRKTAGWEGDVVRYFRRPDVPGISVCKHCNDKFNNHGWIDTLEGGHNVCPGDWIITGVKGENYPCKPDVFIETYEAV